MSPTTDRTSESEQARSTVWFVRRPNGQVLRAHDLETIQQHIESGELTRDCEVRLGIDGAWTQLEEVTRRIESKAQEGDPKTFEPSLAPVRIQTLQTDDQPLALVPIADEPGESGNRREGARVYGDYIESLGAQPVGEQLPPLMQESHLPLNEEQDAIPAQQELPIRGMIEDLTECLSQALRGQRLGLLLAGTLLVSGLDAGLLGLGGVVGGPFQWVTVGIVSLVTLAILGPVAAASARLTALEQRGGHRPTLDASLRYVGRHWSATMTTLPIAAVAWFLSFLVVEGLFYFLCRLVPLLANLLWLPNVLFVGLMLVFGSIICLLPIIQGVEVCNSGRAVQLLLRLVRRSAGPLLVYRSLSCGLAVVAFGAVAVPLIAGAAITWGLLPRFGAPESEIAGAEFDTSRETAVTISIATGMWAVFDDLPIGKFSLLVIAALFLPVPLAYWFVSDTVVYLRLSSGGSSGAKH